MEWVSGFAPDRAEAMVLLARNGARASPHDPRSRLALARALQGVGRHEEAFVEALAAQAGAPSVTSHLLLAELLMEQGNPEDALLQAETALALDPRNRAAQTRVNDIRAMLNRLDGASTDAGSDVDWSHYVTRAMAAFLGPELTIELCERQLSANPGNTHARYLKAITLASLGRVAEAKALISLTAGVVIREMPAPEGHGRDARFREALKREIRTNPTLIRDPRGKATIGGLQTRRLRQPGAIAVEALLAQLREAVDDYVARAAVDTWAPPEKGMLEAWAVVYSAGGRQKSHIHPSAWLSGVYYVDAPLPPADDPCPGALILGQLESGEHPFPSPWGTREIEPVPGRLVLFPSYVPHATEPSSANGERISIAFDVLSRDRAPT